MDQPVDIPVQAPNPPPVRTRGSRRVVVVAMLAAAAVLGIDTVGWWWITRRIEQEVAVWQQDRRAEGMAVSAGQPSRAGWPLKAELLLPAVTVASVHTGQSDNLAWQAEQVRLVFAPWRPTKLDVLVDGRQTVSVGVMPPVNITADRLDLTVPLSLSGQAQGFMVTGQNIALPLERGPVSVDRLSVRLRADDVFISLTGAALPGRSLPFGGAVRSLDIHARSTGALPPLQDPAAGLTLWRDQGSRLLLDDLALVWGPLDVHGHASLGLDAALQPEGSGEVQMTGFVEVTEALARSGAISRNDARVASTLLGLLAKPGAGGPGRAAEVDLPLTLRDRTLSAGAIPLMRIPALAWP